MMEAAGLYVMDSCKRRLSKIDILKGIISEKMTLAVREILAVVETTMTGYESEILLLKRELKRKNDRLNAILQPRVHLNRVNEDVATAEVFGVAKEVPKCAVGKKRTANGNDARQNEHQNESNEDDDRSLGFADLPSDSSMSGQVSNEENEMVQIKRKRGIYKQTDHFTLDSEIVANKWENENEWNKNKKKKHLIERKIGLLKNCPDPDVSNCSLKRQSQVQSIFCQQTPLKHLKDAFPELCERQTFAGFLGDDGDEAKHDLENEMSQTQRYNTFRNARKESVFYISPKEKEEETGKTGTEENTGGGEPSETGEAEEQEFSSDREDDEDQRLQHDDDEDLRPQQNDKEDRRLQHDDDEDLRLQQNDDGDWTPQQNKDRRPQHDDDEEPCAIRKKKSQREQVKCKVCGVLFKSRKSLAKHAANHLDEGVCAVCGEKVESEQLKLHLETLHKLHQCLGCARVFVTAAAFQKHADNCGDEKGSKTKEKPHKCDVCAQSFWFRGQLHVHQRQHTGESPYSCDVCGKQLSNYRNLWQHKLTHPGDESFSCEQCGRVFYSSILLKKHQKIHDARERNFLCEICSKTFHTKGSLVWHQKRHDGSLLVKCPVCEKLLKGDLEDHLLTHSGEKPFGCSECGASYRKRSHLTGHVNAVHLGLKPFACAVCGHRFGRKEHMEMHMRTHTGHKPYACALCDKAYTQHHCLKTHMKSEHRA